MSKYLEHLIIWNFRSIKLCLLCVIFNKIVSDAMPLASPHFFAFTVPCMNAKFVFILFLFLYVSKCLNVSPAPSTTYMRSELLVKRLEIELTSMLPLTLLCVCMILHFLPQIDLNCRFITFDTQLNTLPVSVRERRHDMTSVYSYYHTF